MSKLETLINSRRDFAKSPNMWFVGSYEIYKGSIEPIDQGKLAKKSESIWDLPSDGVSNYFPLQDPSLYSSFIRMGIRGRPSEKKVLGWVNQYGLLQLDQEARFPGGGSISVLDGVLNQAPMSVEDFGDEVMRARSAMLLYQDLRRADERKLQERLITMRENPTSQKVGPLSEIDHKLVDAYAGPKKLNWPLRLVARGLLESFIERKLSSVRLSLWNMAEATDMDDEGTDRIDEYIPVQSWRCPDLLSMLYLQFYLVMVNAVPLRICEHPRCRTPFPANRKDKRFCTETCRSGARRYD